MKKRFVFLWTLLAAFFLTACGQTSTTTPAQSTGVQATTVTIQVTANDKTTKHQAIFEQGDSVMDVLDDYYNVEDEDGLITAIDGVSQNPSTNTYWMYKINGEMASKGAEEQLVVAGDTVEFYLETFE